MLRAAMVESGHRRADTLAVQLALYCLLWHCSESSPLALFWEAAQQDNDIGRAGMHGRILRERAASPAGRAVPGRAVMRPDPALRPSSDKHTCTSDPCMITLIVQTKSVRRRDPHVDHASLILQERWSEPSDRAHSEAGHSGRPSAPAIRSTAQSSCRACGSPPVRCTAFPGKRHRAAARLRPVGRARTRPGSSPMGASRA